MATEEARKEENEVDLSLEETNALKGEVNNAYDRGVCKETRLLFNQTITTLPKHQSNPPPSRERRQLAYQNLLLPRHALLTS